MATLDEVIARMTPEELAADYEAYLEWEAKEWNAQGKAPNQYIPIPHDDDEY